MSDDLNPFERQVYQTLIGDMELGGHLATWAGLPAVFNQYPEPDEDPKWGTSERDSHMPHVVFSLSFGDDPSRDTDGVLALTTWGLIGEQKALIDCDKRMRTLINESTFRSDIGIAGLRWRGSDWLNAIAANTNTESLGFVSMYDLLLF